MLLPTSFSGEFGDVFRKPTGLDTRFLAPDISTGKLRRGAFETDLA
jgi:hypothetical protein